MSLFSWLTNGTQRFYDQIASGQAGYSEASLAFKPQGLFKRPGVDMKKLVEMLRDSQTEHFNENRVSPLNDKGPPSLKIVPGDIFALSSNTNHPIMLNWLKTGKKGLSIAQETVEYLVQYENQSVKQPVFEVLADVLFLAAQKARMLSKSDDQHPAEVYKIRTEGVNLPPRNLYDDLSSLESLTHLCFKALGQDHKKTKAASEVIFDLRSQLTKHDAALGQKLNDALKGAPARTFGDRRTIPSANGKHTGKH